MNLDKPLNGGFSAGIRRHWKRASCKIGGRYEHENIRHFGTERCLAASDG